MPAAAADCFATKWRTSGARSRISITEPSPMMVAPNMPGTLLICGPTGLTTISREPITVSMWTAARRSPARTINSGNWPVLSSVAYEVPKPSNSDNWCNWYCSPPYSIVRSPPVMRAVISSRGMRDTACTDVIGTANVVSPARTVIACVTASVNGKRMLKTVPRPRSDSMVSEPPRCRISLATTSMPTPRPDNWLTSLAVENPVCSTKLNNSLSEIGTSGCSKPRSIALARIASRSKPAPSSDTRTSTSVPWRPTVMVTVPSIGLPCATRSGGASQGTAQVRHHGLERHHARAHQAVLQIGVHPRLLQQQRFGLARLVIQDVLDRSQVGHRLGQRARVLLQVREAVEFQRVERGAFAGFVLALVARQDLGFGFDLELAQLFAQAQHRLVQFDQVEAEVADLLLQARAIDRGLACGIDQRIEQVGTHADQFRGRVHLGIDQSRRLARGGRRRGGRGRLLRLLRGCRRLGTGTDGAPVCQCIEAIDGIGRRRDRPALADALDHVVQAIETTLQRIHFDGF